MSARESKEKRDDSVSLSVGKFQLHIHKYCVGNLLPRLDPLSNLLSARVRVCVQAAMCCSCCLWRGRQTACICISHPNSSPVARTKRGTDWYQLMSCSSFSLYCSITKIQSCTWRYFTSKQTPISNKKSRCPILFEIFSPTPHQAFLVVVYSVPWFYFFTQFFSFSICSGSGCTSKHSPSMQCHVRGYGCSQLRRCRSGHNGPPPCFTAVSH